jgi:carbon-monoxide dehydrogenase medium subunit
VLASTAAAIGDLQVRNRGTIGGSVAHADPGADYPTVLLLLGATFHTSTREIPVEDFFVDFFTTALQPGELLTAVTVPSTEGASAIYLKHRHPASSFAVVGVAAMTRGAETRIAIGGVTPTPVRVSAAEAVTESLQNPIGDSYASGEFRLHLAQLMTKRALSQLTS